MRSISRASLMRTSPGEPIAIEPVSGSGSRRLQWVELSLVPDNLIDICGERAPAEQNDLERVDHNPDVEPERDVLDVVEVVTHLLDLFFEAVRIAIPDLRPARDAGPDRGSKGVERDLLGKQGDVRRRVRPRPDEIHVPAQDVDKLWQLVEPEAAQPLPEPRDPLRVVPGPLRAVGGRRPHRPELHEPEGAAAGALAALDEEDRAGRVELDGERNDGEGRRERHETDDRDHQADG